MQNNQLLNTKIDSKDAKQIISSFSTITNSLRQVLTKTENYTSQISNATKNFIEFEVERTLESIDIEAVNEGGLSVRVSLLKKAGLSNFLKVYKLTNTSRLYNIKGISSSSAYYIKKGVDQTAKELKSTIVPRINADNKNKVSSSLVQALYVYINTESFIKTAQDLHTKYNNEIQQHITNAKKLVNKFSWFFTSKQNKLLAINSYNELKELEEENYINQATFVLNKIKGIENESHEFAWQDYINNSAKYYAVLEKLQGFKTQDTVILNGLPLSLAENINNVKLDLLGLKCTLRSYQEFGVKYIINQNRVLLGDEMGLGKTVQAIASIVHLKNQGQTHFLVVCPASVLINWCREITLHSNLNAIKLHGENRDENFEIWKTSGGVAVTTYETLAKLDFSTILNISMLVSDESHYVKNPRAKRTINLLKLVKIAKSVLFMTGTALENNVEEMCFLINCLNPEIGRAIKHLEHLSSAQIFREKVAPVYFRRTREDVLKELPDLIESEEWCEMTNEESTKYINSTMGRNFMAMRQVSWNVDTSCSSKAQRLLEIFDRAKQEKRKVIVFSYFLNTINQVKTLLNDNCFGPIDGSISPEERQKIIDEFSASEDGSVLVAQVQAGGTGLNIQCASFVVLCEPQLKPSTENQAISRTYRMGQVRNVMVFRLLCENSVDERIMEILGNKQTIFNSFADKSVMGEHSIQITEQMQNKIIDREIERLKNNTTI